MKKLQNTLTPVINRITGQELVKTSRLTFKPATEGIIAFIALLGDKLLLTIELTKPAEFSRATLANGNDAIPSLDTRDIGTSILEARQAPDERLFRKIVT